MWFLYFLSDLGYIAVYYLIKYRKDVVETNLKNSFPNLTNIEIKILEKKFYHHFCDIFIEILKAFTISEKDVKKRFKVKNPDLLKKYFDSGRSIIYYTSHQGNWEWLSFLPLFVPYQVTSLYTKPSSGYFDEFMKIMRSRFGLVCIEAKKGYKTILEFHQNNTLTLNLIAGDQCPTPNSTKYWTTFLNQETAFLIGTDRIAKKSNQVVIFPSYRKIKRGYYELDFNVVETEPSKINDSRIIDNYARLLENSIIKSPELWLWSHKRWKLKKSTFK